MTPQGPCRLQWIITKLQWGYYIVILLHSILAGILQRKRRICNLSWGEEKILQVWKNSERERAQGISSELKNMVDISGVLNYPSTEMKETTKNRKALEERQPTRGQKEIFPPDWDWTGDLGVQRQDKPTI